jgi:hypothetical protein
MGERSGLAAAGGCNLAPAGAVLLRARAVDSGCFRQGIGVYLDICGMGTQFKQIH